MIREASLLLILLTPGIVWSQPNLKELEMHEISAATTVKSAAIQRTIASEPIASGQESAYTQDVSSERSRENPVLGK